MKTMKIILFSMTCENPVYDMIFNGSITESEIIDAIKNIKYSKAAGIDNFVNEYFKYSQPKLISIYHPPSSQCFGTDMI